MKFKNITLTFALMLSIAFSSNAKINKVIDPYIGTGGHGHSFLGVTTPFGAVQIGPNNFNKGWDWCSGYHHSDSIVIGFSHLHLNGTGCTEGGDLLFMPYTGELQTQPGSQENPSGGYASHYSHKNEEVSSAYYSLYLDDYKVKAEFTATDRVAFHRYTFPKYKENKQVMINLKDDSGGTTTDSYMEQINETTVQGYRFSRAWAPSQQIYFTAVFSKPVKLILYNDNDKVEGKKYQSRAVKANLCFDNSVTEVSVKVGISPVSMDNAMANITAELPGWNFKKTVKQTAKKWDNELNVIKIKTKDAASKTIFYTALYHAFMQPIAFNDYNKDYRGSDKKVYPKASFDNYTVFSLWDTYRAAHPLYTILQPARVPHFINSMLAINDEQGLLPVWHLYGSDTKEMIGIQSVPVIADAIMKGVKGFDYERAFQAMKSSMLSDYKSLSYVRNNKYIPSDKENESVAKGLEYAIADWGIAQVAKKLGHKADYELFSARAEYYKLYWDNKTHFFRGVNADGSFSTPFDPSKSRHRQDDYCEGTGWQYTWLVPQDVEGLIGLFGSEKAFTTKLDSLFALDKSLLGDEVSPDISGLIGQYAHGNEPGHHTVYLYAFAGQQWKTAEKVREILKTMYFDNPNGLAGNEDCGQMSSWYVFSALGFYPVNPSNGVYVFGSPLFDKATISLPEDKKFEIITKNNSDKNIYIQSVEFNGKNYPYSFITHKDIMQGGKLIFTMGNVPNKEFGTKMEYRPKSKN